MPRPRENPYYCDPWKGGEPYGPKELIRLERSCQIIRDHAARPAPGRPCRILDVGCGTGPLHQWLGDEQFQIVGLEISTKAAEIAARHYHQCKVTDLTEPWPIEQRSFDAVHAGAVMEHVMDWHAPLNHANTALRDGGLIVISVPNLRYWKEIRRLIMGRQPHWINKMEHVHAYTPGFLCDLVSLHGFEVTSLQADRVNLPLLKWAEPRLCRWCARIGSVLILAARLTRRARVEDATLKHLFPDHTTVALDSIDVTPPTTT